MVRNYVLNISGNVAFFNFKVKKLELPIKHLNISMRNCLNLWNEFTIRKSVKFWHRKHIFCTVSYILYGTRLTRGGETKVGTWHAHIRRLAAVHIRVHPSLRVRGTGCTSHTSGRTQIVIRTSDPNPSIPTLSLQVPNALLLPPVKGKKQNMYLYITNYHINTRRWNYSSYEYLKNK
jgi:hypothetical protein